MNISKKNYLKVNKGITLIALVVTIIILIILAGISINLVLGENGIIINAQKASSEHEKQAATEKMNLKITNLQIGSYAQYTRMPTLQELADKLCEDNEMEYVVLESQAIATLDKIVVGDNKSIFTKMKEYPYEFEINSSLQLASIDGVKIATNNQVTITMTEEELNNKINTAIANVLNSKNYATTSVTNDLQEQLNSRNYKTGKATMPSLSNASADSRGSSLEVIFDEPFEDDQNYIVLITRSSGGYYWAQTSDMVKDLTKNGFTIYNYLTGVSNSTTGTATVTTTNYTVDWLAIPVLDN